MKHLCAILALAVVAATGSASAADDDTHATDDAIRGTAAAIGYSTVAAALEALRADPEAKFSEQQGWTVVASREQGRAVQWFFPPQGHPAYPSVVKRVVGERRGVGVIDMAALCGVSQTECDRLIDDFRQVSEAQLRRPPPQRVTLDVGVTLNDHDRVRIHGLVAEDGKAAEIRLDGTLKVVIVPTLDDGGAVMYWIAMYEFDGRDYVLLSRPQLTMPGSDNAAVQVASSSGTTFGFSITRLRTPEAASG
jgi:hypothetical protein